MMIQRTQTGSTITLAVSGKLDSVTKTELADEVEASFKAGITGLVFDFSALEYISSAGLRVLFAAKKTAAEAGVTMKVVGASQQILEVFRIVSFFVD